MPVDSSIALGVQAPTPADPLAAAAKAFTLKQAMQNAQLGDMELQDQMTLREAFRGPQARNPDGSINFDSIMREVGGKASPKMMMTLSKGAEEQRAKQLQVAQAKQEIAGKLDGFLSQSAAGLLPQIDAVAKEKGVDAAIKQFAPQLEQIHNEVDPLMKQLGRPHPPLDMSNTQGIYDGIKTMAGRYKPTTEHERVLEKAADRRAAATERTAAASERRAAAAETKAKATSGFEGKNGELMASLAERGVSLPTGFRSKEQQIGLLNALWKRNPDKSADQIADMVKSGQLDLANIKKAGQVAAGMAGKVAYADEELQRVVPLVREASSKLPRGEWIPYNKLKQMGQESFSNPDLARFRQRMTMLSNAFDMLAARGGTDKEKRAEQRKSFETAPSQEALEAVLQSVEQEAKISGEAAGASVERFSGRSRVKTDDNKKRRPLSEFGGG